MAKKQKISLMALVQRALYITFIVFLSVGLIVLTFYYGVSNGFSLAREAFEPATNYSAPVNSDNSGQSVNVEIRDQNWGGPDLWEAVNKRRTEFGVNPLSTKSEVCTIASIRLNELLDLGTLDGHEGFSNMSERREDLSWVFEKFNLTEFLVAGAESPEDAVSLWENTLGHKKLRSGGEYVWGCIYAQGGFGVAITAF